MRVIGSVTRRMYYEQNRKFISHTDLQLYEIPLESMCAVDIGRTVYLDEKTGEVTIESFKNKVNRERKAYIYTIEENRPIINDTNNGPH